MSTFYETDDELLSEVQKRRRIQALNDELRAKLRSQDVDLGEDELFITRGLAQYGTQFVDRALSAVREFSEYTEANDPYSEHDFGAFEIDSVKLSWKIDCYDRFLCWSSPDPSDPEATRRVLTIMLADEY